MEGLPQVQVLQGHTSPETAFVVNDYPYGRKLRCQIRYWVETATKGSKAGQQRFMRQTTDPRRDNEVWNAPKGSTYVGQAIMYKDPATGYVEWTGVSAEFGISPEQDARYQFTGILDQMTEEQRMLYNAYLTTSQKYTRPWIEYAATVQVLCEYADANDGNLPEPVNGVVEIPAGTLPDRPLAFRRHLGDHWAVYVQAVAAERARRQAETIGTEATTNCS